MTKKSLITLLLTLAILLSSVSACLIGVSAVTAGTITAGDATFKASDADIIEYLKGDAEKGYYFRVTSAATAQLVTEAKYPISKLTFDLNLGVSGVGSYGFFGISKDGSIQSNPTLTDSNNINFIYTVVGSSGDAVNIAIVKDGTTVNIARIQFVGSDRFLKPSVVNISFVKKGSHWYLALNGNVCNNIEENAEAAQLDKYFGSEFFDKNREGYFRFGINTVSDEQNTMYFKPLTAFANDWQVTANETFAYEYNGKTYEWRGQGITGTTVQSKIPEIATGTREAGHIIDFTGTDGWAQSSVGFDLKTTTFEFSPIVASNFKDEFSTYLAFTADTALLKDHSAKPGDMVEFLITSASNAVTANVITNTEACSVEPTVASKTALATRKNLNNTSSNYKSNLVKISFVEEKGPDSNNHWYMKVTIGTKTTVYKGKNEASDVYLRFDDIIERRVYFRMGTTEKTNSSLKLYCKASEWPENGGINDLSEEERNKINDIQLRINALPTPTKDNYKSVEATVTQILADIDALSSVAKEFVEVTRINDVKREITALKALYECGDWYVKNGDVAYSGDKWIDYSFASKTDGSVIATTSADYDITKYSLYWKGIYVPNAWFSFGLTTDMQSELLPKSGDETVAFILTPSANALIIQYWDPIKRVAEYIGEADGEGKYPDSVFNEFEYYNRSKQHTFTVVKLEDGHWYIKIDDRIFNGKYFDTLDAYMEAHAKSSKIRFAGYTGLGDCSVNIKDPTVDDTVVPDELKAEVKAFEDKITALGGVSSVNSDNLSEKEKRVNELLAEYEALESKIKKYVSNKHLLDAVKNRIAMIKQASSYGDWYPTKENVTYDPKDQDGYYRFDNCLNTDGAYATTTKAYDITKNAFEWTSLSINHGSWFAISFTSDYTKEPLSATVSDKITFICTMSNSDIVVQYWDNAKRLAVELQDPLFGNAMYSGFDIFNPDKSHTYGMTKGSDGHWYLYIDNVLFDGKFYDTIDNFMENYGESSYVTFGAYKGFGGCFVRIVESEYSDGSVEIDSGDIKGNLTEAQKYLQLLEENYVKIWENDKSTAEMAFNAWSKLDYRAQLEVEAVLMDDYYMWDIHDLVATYAPELYVTSVDGSLPVTVPQTGDSRTSRAVAAGICLMLSAVSLAALICYRKRTAE